MPAATTIARIDHEASQWDQAFYAFLAEKERRSGSIRTVASYSRMLDHFWSGIGKSPDQVKSTDVFSWTKWTTQGAQYQPLAAACRSASRRRRATFSHAGWQ
jgi:hypothetical protein